MAAAPVLPKLVGQRVKRREDPRLIQGRGTYVDDVKIAGMQHLAFKRSDVAHGRIRAIDTSAAKAMDGVEAVFTGVQIAELLAPMPIGTPFPSPEHRAVAVDTVRFVGDPVAVVVACDRYAARDAADAIVVDYEPLPAVVDPEQAMNGQSAALHADFPNNVALGPLPSGTGVGRKGAVDDTAVDAAFEAADVVISQRMVNQRLAPSSIEARGVVAHYEPGREALTIWSSSQNPHILRTFVARMLDLGEDRVRAIAPEVGGGFGAKINIYGEEYVAAALSKRLGLPIKWIEDRSEAFLATVHGRDPDRLRRAGGDTGRQGARPADAHHRRHRRLQHAAHRRRADQQHDDGQRDLRVPRHPRHAHGGVHQQDADRRVSRRGPARGGLLRREGDGHAGPRAGDGIRPSSGGRTSSSRISSPTRPIWGRSTTRATTRRRSTTPCTFPAGKRSRPSGTRRAPTAGSSVSDCRCTSRSAAWARPPRCRRAAGSTRRSPSSGMGGSARRPGCRRMDRATRPPSRKCWPTSSACRSTT